MLQQAPRSPEEEIKAKITAFRGRVQSESTILATMDDLNEQIGFVRMLAGTDSLKLNDEQIKTILQQQSSTVDEIMRLQETPGNPHIRLAIQIILATAVATWKPGISAGFLSNIAVRQTLHGLFAEQLGLYNKVIDLVMLVAMLGLSSHSLHSLSNAAIAQIEETYGATMATLAIPAAMILYNKTPDILAAIADSETVEVASDFFDLMYGRADDEVYEKYHGTSLATMTVGDMTSSVGGTLSWMWNKLPSLRSQAPLQLALPDAPSVSPSSSLKK